MGMLRMTFHSARIKRFNSQSNCGMELWNFNRSPAITAEKMGWKWFLRETRDKDFGGKIVNYPRHLIVFSGNIFQNGQDISPHSFATWLREIGEKVAEGDWVAHGSGQIKAYFWGPSAAFYNELAKRAGTSF